MNDIHCPKCGLTQVEIRGWCVNCHCQWGSGTSQDKPEGELRRFVLEVKAQLQATPGGTLDADWDAILDQILLLTQREPGEVDPESQNGTH